MTTNPNPPAKDNPVPAPVQTLVDLFAAELVTVSFPDVNRDVLEQHAGRVRTCHDAVVRLETDLAAARTALAEAQDALLGKAQRALAYARVFSEDNAELAARLDAISLPRGPRRAARSDPSAPPPPADGKAEKETPTRKGRGRPKASGLLFVDNESRAEAQEA
ncbi:MAG: hypothetical protein HY904_06850 [Deltaproteobacteria bacterium]|nr:hypothetical protein [Deltaproteobacteria bacterium]